MAWQRVDPALYGYLEKSGGKHRKRQMIFLQQRIALPAKDIESGDQDLHTANHGQNAKTIFFF